MALEEYAEPPISEVVCGFRFEPVPGLDPLTIGWFAREVANEYPNRQLQPALSESGARLHVGLVPIRAWLTSEDEAFLLQVQHDRFYLNWRARGPSYPRFEDHDGRPGVLRRALEEFDRFRTFCRRELAQEVSSTITDLAKVDRLVQGRHWETRADLLDVLPALKPLADLIGGTDGPVGIQLQRTVGEGQVVLTVTVDEESEPKQVKLESRSWGPIAEQSLETSMQSHNSTLNQLFERAIPRDQRVERFGGVSR